MPHLKRYSNKKIESNFFECIDIIKKYTNEIDEINITGKKTVAKSIRFTGLEAMFINGFLSNNNITIGELAKFLFYQIGAFDDLSVYTMSKKKMNIDFALFDYRKWDLDAHKLIDNNNAELLSKKHLEDLYIKMKKETSAPSFNIHKFQSNLMDEFISSHVDIYSHFNKFIKMQLFEYKILPQGLKDVLYKNMKTKSTKGDKGSVAKSPGHSITLTTHPFERIYIDNFVAYIKSINKKLTLSRIIKYRLHQLRYIDDMIKYPINTVKDDLKLLKSGYKASCDYTNEGYFKENSSEGYKEIYLGFKSGSSNIAISFSKEDIEKLTKSYKEENYKTITMFVRDKVFEFYNIYPDEEIMKIIKNPPHKIRGRKKKIQ